jgi:hypothetical protein
MEMELSALKGAWAARWYSSGYASPNRPNWESPRVNIDGVIFSEPVAGYHGT